MLNVRQNTSQTVTKLFRHFGLLRKPLSANILHLQALMYKYTFAGRRWCGHVRYMHMYLTLYSNSGYESVWRKHCAVYSEPALHIISCAARRCVLSVIISYTKITSGILLTAHYSICELIIVCSLLLLLDFLICKTYNYNPECHRNCCQRMPMLSTADWLS